MASMTDRIPMTSGGYLRLEEELKRLKNDERPAVIRALADAREHGDLSENAEYHDARERQSFIEGRMLEIEDKLARAAIIDISQHGGSTIQFGARVKLVDEETEEEAVYQIVGPEEAEVQRGLLSISAPLGQALIGREAGDTGPLLTWLTVPGESYAACLEAGIDVTAYTVDELETIAATARDLGVPARVQLKVDSGLSRGGSSIELWPGLVEAAAAAEESGAVRITGIWTHPACADEPKHPANDEQEQTFHEMPRAEWEALRDETLAYVEVLRKSGHLISTEPLKSARTAVTVRVRDGAAQVLDGPYAETKEQLGGYFLIEAKDRSEAARVAIERDGMTFVDANNGNLRPHPLLPVERDARAAMVAALRHLNLDITPPLAQPGRPPGGSKGKLSIVRTG